MEVGEPESERVVVLDVHVVGGVVWEWVDVMFRVVVAFKDLVIEAVEPLVNPRAVSRNVSRRRVFVFCSVLVSGFLKEMRGLAIVDRGLGGGSISWIDVVVKVLWSRMVQMGCTWGEIATHGEW